MMHETTGVRAIEGEGDVGEGNRAVGEEVWENAEDVHCRTREVEDDLGWCLPRFIRCIVQGMVVYQVEVEGGRGNAAAGAVLEG